MFAIFRKEISGFFSSLTGYIVILVFLLINSLFMWVFPGEWNIFDTGYAGLDTLVFPVTMGISLPCSCCYNEDDSRGKTSWNN